MMRRAEEYHLTSFINQYTWPYGHNYLYSVHMQNILNFPTPPPPQGIYHYTLRLWLDVKAIKNRIWVRTSSKWFQVLLLQLLLVQISELKEVARHHPATPTSMQ